MTEWALKIVVISDATFGRGDGVAGLVDEEIEHDNTTGLPYLRGRQLKGLLVEECTNLLYVIGNAKSDVVTTLKSSAHFLFGRSGSSVQDNAGMRVGQARLPYQVELQVREQLGRGIFDKADILESLTTIRRQTAVSDDGVPEDNSLRSMRVLLRGLSLYASLTFSEEPTPSHLALLSACAAATHRAGTGRNRGRGRLHISLLGDSYDQTEQYLNIFAGLIGARQ